MKYDHKVKYNGIWYSPGEDVPVEKEEKQVYTKSDITTMRVDDLRHLAASVNVPNVEEMTGAELKQILLAKFGL